MQKKHVYKRAIGPYVCMFPHFLHVIVQDLLFCYSSKIPNSANSTEPDRNRNQYIHNPIVTTIPAKQWWPSSLSYALILSFDCMYTYSLYHVSVSECILRVVKEQFIEFLFLSVYGSGVPIWTSEFLLDVTGLVVTSTNTKAGSRARARRQQSLSLQAPGSTVKGEPATHHWDKRSVSHATHPELFQ